MSYHLKPKHTSHLLLQNGMQTSTSKWMMMFTLILVSFHKPFSCLSEHLFQEKLDQSIVLLFRNAWFYVGSPQIKTASVHWLHEVWTCPCSKVSNKVCHKLSCFIFTQIIDSFLWIFVCAEESSTMSRNTGSLVKKETNTSDMPLDKSTPSPKI